MDVKRFKMTNIGQFSKLDMLWHRLPTNVTVFIGNNDCGKTSVLSAMGISLSLLIH